MARISLHVASLFVVLATSCAAVAPARGREPPATAAPMRARDLGVAPGVLPTGPLDAITDVAGVRVGHVTLALGESIRTGVTAVLPHGGNVFRDKVPAALVVANGFGKLVGATQLVELGEIETPILLTNTLQVWDAAAAIVEHTLAQPGNEDVRSVNPVVGETNDGFLSDIRARPLRREHFLEAIASAREGKVAEGAVGAGTGTVAFGYKAGIGTASRRVGEGAGAVTVGVLVQANFGGDLVLAGVPVGRRLGAPSTSDRAGSCMIVIATDAPLDARQLARLARRAFAGMARTGAGFSHGSGDYAIAFATTRAGAPVRDADLSPLFVAVADATEEAIVSSLSMARETRGHGGHTAPALPTGRVADMLRKQR
jgi:D-aminopeptidase